MTMLVAGEDGYTGGRLDLLAGAAARGWPRLTVGRRAVGPGELAWRQAVTLTTAEELPQLEAALVAVVPTSAPLEEAP